MVTFMETFFQIIGDDGYIRAGQDIWLQWPKRQGQWLGCNKDDCELRSFPKILIDVHNRCSLFMLVEEEMVK